MNRWIAKAAQGLTRLAFWRKSDVPIPESAEPTEPETTAHMEKPVGWLARLKHLLPRRRNSARMDSDPTDPIPVVAEKRPPRKPDDERAAVAESVESKPSLLAILKSKLRRAPKLEQAETGDAQSSPGSGKPAASTRSSEAESEDEGDEIQLSPKQRVVAILSNKKVWISGVSVLLLALIASMSWMLLQAGQEKKQLQTELVAAKKQLKQADVAQPKTVSPEPPTQAPLPVAAGERPARSASSAESGECDVTSKENVAENLKNCIDSFNAMSN